MKITKKRKSKFLNVKFYRENKILIILNIASENLKKKMDDSQVLVETKEFYRQQKTLQAFSLAFPPHKNI